MANLSMADLLAKQSASWRIRSLHRGEEVEGTVVAILADEIILDVGGKAEGVLSKKDLSLEQLSQLKIGYKLSTFVIYPENESGQVVLALQRLTSKSGSNNARFYRFELAQKNNQLLIGKVREANKGGLVLDVGGMRGFLPMSQINLFQVDNLDELIDKEIRVKVIEVDSSQNRIIFAQVVDLPDDLKNKLASLNVGETVTGKIQSILSFGLVVRLDNDLEGLVHISESAWEKIEDPTKIFKVGDDIKAKVISIDNSTGRVNLSIKQLQTDPFTSSVQNFQVDDVVKGEIAKVTSNGVSVTLKDNVEGFIPASKLESDVKYNLGDEITCIVDSVDAQRRRVNLAPFITSTKDLIYK